MIPIYKDQANTNPNELKEWVYNKENTFNQTFDIHKHIQKGPINDMNEIPCKNCLIFPICKAQIHEYKDSLSLFGIYDCILRPKCSLIKEWVGPAVYPTRNRFLRFKTIDNLFIKKY